MDARNDLTLSVTTPSDREIVLTRTFNAPRKLVWDAVTKAEHVQRWYGCAAFTFATCEIDLRVGGSYRYTMRTPDGVDHTMTGVYREIVMPERIVHTERYETTGFTSPDALVTMTLTEQGGRTKLQTHRPACGQGKPRRPPQRRHGEWCARDLRSARGPARDDVVTPVAPPHH